MRGSGKKGRRWLHHRSVEVLLITFFFILYKHRKPVRYLKKECDQIRIGISLSNSPCFVAVVRVMVIQITGIDVEGI